MTRRLTAAARTALTVCFILAAPRCIPAQTLAPDHDHFDCYPTPMQPLLQYDIPAATLTLLDYYFFPPGTSPVQTVTVGELFLHRFCNPVQKTHNGVVTKITNPLDHLALYVIITNNVPPVPAPEPSVVVSNQFGAAQTLNLGPAIVLAVPSGKVEANSATAAPTPPAIPTNLDHFVCYFAHGNPIGTNVGLQDQFDTIPIFNAVAIPVTETKEVAQPVLFCDEAWKNLSIAPPAGSGSKITVPPDSLTSPPNFNYHLACYNLLPVTPALSFPETVFINNQLITPPLGPASELELNLNSGSDDLLCVPSVVSPNPNGGT